MDVINHLPPVRLQDGDPAGAGVLVFGGYGQNTVTQALQLHPGAQTAAGDPFHSALWVSDTDVAADHTLMVQCQSHVQLRWAPEPWHCAWVLPAYQDRNNLHYVIAKPNGWEYGMRHPSFVVGEAEATPERPANDGQAILAGGDFPRYPLGTPVLFTITTKGRRLAISLNGQMVFNRLIATRLLNLVPFSGRVGVMTEDCTVTVNEVVTCVPSARIAVTPTLDSLAEARLRRDHAYWVEYSGREDMPESIRTWAKTKAETMEWVLGVLGLEVKP